MIPKKKRKFWKQAMPSYILGKQQSGRKNQNFRELARLFYRTLESRDSGIKIVVKGERFRLAV